MRCPHCGFHHLQAKERCVRCRKPLDLEPGEPTEDSSASLDQNDLIINPTERLLEAEDTGDISEPSMENKVLQTEMVEDEESLIAETEGEASVELKIEKERTTEKEDEPAPPEQLNEPTPGGKLEEAGERSEETVEGPDREPAPPEDDDSVSDVQAAELEQRPQSQMLSASDEPDAPQLETQNPPDSIPDQESDTDLHPESALDNESGSADQLTDEKMSEPAANLQMRTETAPESSGEAKPAFELDEEPTEDEQSGDTTDLLGELDRLLSEKREEQETAAPSEDEPEARSVEEESDPVTPNLEEKSPRLPDDELLASLGRKITAPRPQVDAQEQKILPPPGTSPVQEGPVPVSFKSRGDLESGYWARSGETGLSPERSEGVSSTAWEVKQIDHFFGDNSEENPEPQEPELDEASNIKIKPQESEEPKSSALNLPLGGDSTGSGSLDRPAQAKGIRSVRTTGPRPKLISDSWILALKRASAGFFDLAVWIALGVVLYKASLAAAGIGTLHGTAWQWAYLVILPLVVITGILAMVYSSLFGSVTGQTPGMMIFKLKMTGKDGARPRLRLAFLRTGIYLLTILPLGAGLVLTILGGTRGGIHDRISGIRVDRV